MPKQTHDCDKPNCGCWGQQRSTVCSCVTDDPQVAAVTLALSMRLSPAFTVVRGAAACYVCGRQTSPTLKKHGWAWCSKQCKRWKPSAVLKVEAAFGNPIETILAATLDLPLEPLALVLKTSPDTIEKLRKKWSFGGPPAPIPGRLKPSEFLAKFEALQLWGRPS